jgi:tRNA (guanine-N7-)-methyltransferase
VPKNKHRKFAEINTFSNVVQPGFRFPVGEHSLKGNWNKQFFFNNNPIVLEIGCGKGEYTIGMAGAFPERNFLGIDIKGNRLWTGAHYALENGLNNVGFLRVQAEHLYCFFDEAEVSEIWVTFPDPQLNKPRIRKRLTSPGFLEMYRKFLKPGSAICLKTDNLLFYEYTLDLVRECGYKVHTATEDLYNDPGDTDPLVLNIKTYYENIFLKEGKKICFLKFSFE